VEFLGCNAGTQGDVGFFGARNADDNRLPVPAYKKTYTQSSMWYDGLKLFNELGPAIKEERNINRFKESIFVWMKQ
jgi:hypothetical protein